MDSISTIKSKYYKIAKKLNAPKLYSCFNTEPQHDGSAHVELKNGKYNYVVTERGEEYERKTTNDPDEILYWLISTLVYSISSNHELNNRDKNKDFRRKMFKKEVELITQISSEWGAKKAGRTRKDPEKISL
jgi:hypothetical protein